MSIPRKDLPRWLFPKTDLGRFASYVFNPWGVAANVMGSLFMAHTLPEWGRNLKMYAKGDPRAFDEDRDRYLKRQKPRQRPASWANMWIGDKGYHVDAYGVRHEL